MRPASSTRWAEIHSWLVKEATRCSTLVGLASFWFVQCFETTLVPTVLTTFETSGAKTLEPNVPNVPIVCVFLKCTAESCFL